MTERVAVCNLEELPPGERCVHRTEDGREIALFNVEGDVYAISNVCAHRGGPICQGKVGQALVGEFVEPGERVEESFSEDLAVACPLHGWEYDLETGVHLGDDDIRIPTYDATVENGTVFVEL